MNQKATEELALRLTDSEIAAIRLRHQRREKKNIAGTCELDLGDISTAEGSDSSNDSTVVSAVRPANMTARKPHPRGESGFARMHARRKTYRSGRPRGRHPSNIVCGPNQLSRGFLFPRALVVYRRQGCSGQRAGNVIQSARSSFRFGRPLTLG